MPAQDLFASYADDAIMAPVAHATAITPHDDNDLTIVTRGLYVGGAGDVAVILHGGEAVTFTSLAAGVIHPLRVTRVKATGTTATAILGVW